MITSGYSKGVGSDGVAILLVGVKHPMKHHREERGVVDRADEFLGPEALL